MSVSLVALHGTRHCMGLSHAALYGSRHCMEVSHTKLHGNRYYMVVSHVALHGTIHCMAVGHAILYGTRYCMAVTSESCNIGWHIKIIYSLKPYLLPREALKNNPLNLWVCSYLPGTPPLSICVFGWVRFRKHNCLFSIYIMSFRCSSFHEDKASTFYYSIDLHIILHEAMPNMSTCLKEASVTLHLEYNYI